MTDHTTNDMREFFNMVVENAEHYNIATGTEANVLRVNQVDYESHFRWIEKRLIKEYGIAIEVCK